MVVHQVKNKNCKLFLDKIQVDEFRYKLPEITGVHDVVQLKNCPRCVTLNTIQKWDADKEYIGEPEQTFLV